MISERSEADSGKLPRFGLVESRNAGIRRRSIAVQARWLRFPDDLTRRDFTRRETRPATPRDGEPTSEHDGRRREPDDGEGVPGRDAELASEVGQRPRNEAAGSPPDGTRRDGGHAGTAGGEIGAHQPADATPVGTAAVPVVPPSVATPRGVVEDVLGAVSVVTVVLVDVTAAPGAVVEVVVDVVVGRPFGRDMLDRLARPAPLRRCSPVMGCAGSDELVDDAGAAGERPLVVGVVAVVGVVVVPGFSTVLGDVLVVLVATVPTTRRCGLVVVGDEVLVVGALDGVGRA